MCDGISESITFAGVKPLMRALDTNTTLRELDLFCELKMARRHRSRLRHTQGNLIGNDVGAIEAMLLTNTTLRILGLRSDNLICLCLCLNELYVS